MRDYIYRSEAKINMYFDQIPLAAREEIAMKLKINLAVVSAEIETQRQTYDSVEQKLQVVENYIRKKFDINSVDSDKGWVEGELEVRWGIFKDKGIVFFVAKNLKSLFAMAGSDYHLIGNMPCENVDKNKIRRSLLGTLLSDLNDLEIADTPEIYLPENEYYSNRKSHIERDQYWQELIFSCSTHYNWPSQKVSFLAKILAYGREYKDLQISLATPLYIECM